MNKNAGYTSGYDFFVSQRSPPIFKGMGRDQKTFMEIGMIMYFGIFFERTEW